MWTANNEFLTTGREERICSVYDLHMIYSKPSAGFMQCYGKFKFFLNSFLFTLKKELAYKGKLLDMVFDLKQQQKKKQHSTC